MFLLFIVNFLIGVVALTYWYIQHKLQYWKIRGVPHIEPEFFYGNARGVETEYHVSDVVARAYRALKSFGPVCGVYFSIRPSAIITDLDLIKTVLVKDFAKFPNRGFYYNEKDDPVSAHLLHIEDDAWRRLRTKISPTFSSGKLKTMFGTLCEVSDRFIAKITKDVSTFGQFDIRDAFARYTTDVIGSTAFGIECRSLEEKSSKFHKMGMAIFKNAGFLVRMFRYKHAELARKLGMRLYSKELTDFYEDIVRKTIAHRQANPQVIRNDFMNLMIELGDPTKPDPLTFNQIVAQSFVFFGAGFETSSTNMSFLTYELSLNEEIQEKARQSVFQALQKHDNQVTYESLNEMDYLEQCINETLRKYPPGWILPRVAKEDYKVPGTKIVLEKGTAIAIPVIAIHRDPEIYPDPMKFDPDRFSPEEVEKRHPFAFIPFGEGPRICVGKRFALIEVKLALVKLLTNFKFCLDRMKTSVPMNADPKIPMIITPGEAIFLKFSQISSL